MKLAGKIKRREIKDYGKGKGAEAKETVFFRARLDRGADMPPGFLELPLTPEEVAEGSYDLSQEVVLSVEQPQQRLRLQRGGKAE